MSSKGQILVLCSLVSLLSLAKGATDYCDSSLCGTSKHIACDNDGAWSSDCPSSRSAVTFTPAEIKVILNRHNVLRNKLASGAFAKYKPAKRMATTQWNKELATLAALNVKQCKMSHDACHNTKTFKASGQNLALTGYSGEQASKTRKELIISSVKMWWDEKKDANMSVINKYPSNWTGPQIGHFTAMAQEKNTHVGCAAAFYQSGVFNWFLMACNYATTNWVGQPVYQRGVKASGCKKGANAKYKGLCKITEVYDV